MRYDMVRPVYPIPSTHKYIYNYHVFLGISLLQVSSLLRVFSLQNTREF